MRLTVDKWGELNLYLAAGQKVPEVGVTDWGKVNVYFYAEAVATGYAPPADTGDVDAGQFPGVLAGAGAGDFAARRSPAVERHAAFLDRLRGRLADRAVSEGYDRAAAGAVIDDWLANHTVGKGSGVADGRRPVVRRPSSWAFPALGVADVRH